MIGDKLEKIKMYIRGNFKNKNFQLYAGYFFKILFSFILMYLVYIRYDHIFKFRGKFLYILVIDLFSLGIYIRTRKRNIVRREEDKLYTKYIKEHNEGLKNEHLYLTVFKNHTLVSYYRGNGKRDLTSDFDLRLMDLQREHNTLYRIYFCYVPNDMKRIIGDYEIVLNKIVNKDAYIFFNEDYIDKVNVELIENLYYEIDKSFKDIELKILKDKKKIEKIIDERLKKENKFRIYSVLVLDLISRLGKSSLMFAIYYYIYKLGYGEYIILFILAKQGISFYISNRKRRNRLEEENQISL